MKQLLYITSALAILGTTACRKYVEIPPENQRQLKYTRDYQSLLNNSNIIERGYSYVLYAGDDVYSSPGTAWETNTNPTWAAAYTWAPEIYTALQEDQDWSDLYKVIYYANTVIAEVKSSVEGTQAEITKAYSEALVHRAYAYHTLVNIYGKQYDAATANTDPGVPLVLENKFFVDLKRVSVEKVYEQIEKDLFEALPNLARRGLFSSQPGQSAVFSMLSRVYLDKRAFSDAKRYADSALSIQTTLLDLNAYATSTTTYTTKVNNQELIFCKTAGSMPSIVPLAQETINLMDTTMDLRYTVYTNTGSSFGTFYATLQRGYWKPRLVNQGLYIGPTVPEMMLIKAECEARAGNTSAAMDLVNNLRRKRYRTASYYDYTATDAQDALVKVLNERRREMFGTGMRWFDQRRLQKDNGMPTVKTVTRVYKGTTYTLEPGSPRYVFPIAPKYTNLNPEIEQNPR